MDGNRKIDFLIQNGVDVDTGIENNKIEGTTYKKPKEDDVENVTLKCKLSCVKTLFQQLREKSME